ncbi:MAG: hypothetical protein WKF79_01270 [Nocardioides sp.]
MKASQPKRTRIPADDAFPHAFAAAVTARGVSLEWLRSRLADRGTPVSLATLSYWRSGRRRPERLNSLDALAQIEDLLGLPAGDLVNRLGPSRRSGPPVEEVPLSQVADQPDAVRRALEALGFDGVTNLPDVSIHSTLDVDRDTYVRRVRTRSVLRAAADGASRLSIVFTGDSPQPPITDIRVLGGGHLGRDASELSRGLFAREFVLDRPLRLGEETVMEYEIDLPVPAPDCSYVQFLRRRVDEVVLWVRFDPVRMPATAEIFTIVDGEETSSAVDLADTTSIHHRVFRIGPGRVGIRWTW